MTETPAFINDVVVAWREELPEIGEQGTSEIRSLWQWLSPGLLHAGNHPSHWTCRIAPSIIARSEAELFAISTPRFALRVYLDNGRESLGFINARRFAVFCDQAQHWGSLDCQMPKDHDVFQPTRPPRKRPARVLLDQTCLADCLLRLPTASGRWQGFETLLTELGRACGEPSRILGTPYVRHIELAGGGLCAQACCYMATVLRQEDAKGVWSIAEITALVGRHTTSEDASQYLVLTGMTLQETVQYFQHLDKVDLGAIWQRTLLGPQPQYPGKDYAKPFGDSLRAYLRSGMPVLLPLDSGRMQGVPGQVPILGESIFSSNGIPPRLRSRAEIT